MKDSIWYVFAAIIVLIIVSVIAVIIYFGFFWHKQPWQDDVGKWHNKYICRQYQVTDYMYISVGSGKYKHTISIPSGHHMEQDCRYE